MFFTPAVHLRRGTSLINALRNLSLTSNLQGCYDFADVNCYAGSGQTITDLSGQANGLFLGSSSGDTTLDPTFVGTAGDLKADTGFSTGSKTIEGTTPTWMQAVHKDNGKISIIQWTKTTSGSYSMGAVTTAVKNDGSAFQGPGFFFGVSTGTYAGLGLPFFVSLNASVGDVGHFAGTDVITSGSWMFSACAIDEQAGTAVIQINGTQYTGSITYSSPSAASSPNNLGLGPSASTTHFKNMLALWSIALTATQLNDIYLQTKARFA